MAATLRALVAVVIAGATAPVAHDCARTERGLAQALEMARVEKEPEGTIRMVFEQATSALRTCPQREGLMYLRVRSAELGRGVLVGDLPPGGVGELRELTADAVARFPSSARVLTVGARVSRDASLARRALAADRRYVPAQVVLADILVDRGDWREAERVLTDRRALDQTSDGLVVMARVQLAKGDALDALATANRALARRKPDLLEPDAGDARPVMRAHAVAALAALALRRFSEAATHLLQTDPEDPLVRDLLRKPPAELTRALRARQARGRP